LDYALHELSVQARLVVSLTPDYFSKGESTIWMQSIHGFGELLSRWREGPFELQPSYFDMTVIACAWARNATLATISDPDDIAHTYEHRSRWRVAYIVSRELEVAFGWLLTTEECESVRLLPDPDPPLDLFSLPRVSPERELIRFYHLGHMALDRLMSGDGEMWRRGRALQRRGPARLALEDVERLAMDPSEGGAEDYEPSEEDLRVCGVDHLTGADENQPAW
jgi:hypothetical protein